MPTTVSMTAYMRSGSPAPSRGVGAPRSPLTARAARRACSAPADTEYGVYVAKNVAPGGGAGSSWFQLLNSHHNGQLEFRVTSDGAPVVVSNSTLALNTWYYVVATYDGSVAKLFLNGKPDATLKVTAVPKQTSDPLFIGRRTDGHFNDATLADVAIYSVALSPERIAAHWQATSATH